MTEFDELINSLMVEEKEVPKELNIKLKKKIRVKYKYNRLIKAIPMSAVACIAVGVFLVSAINQNERLFETPQQEVKETIISEEIFVEPEPFTEVKKEVKEVKEDKKEKTTKIIEVEKKVEEPVVVTENEGISIASYARKLEPQAESTGEDIDNNFLGVEGRMIEDENILGLELHATDVTPNGLTLIYTQADGNVTGELQTGSQYWIEEEKDGQWGKTDTIINEEDVAWTMQAYSIEEGDSTKMEIDWSYLYGELPTGSYRIKKEITDFRGANDFDNYDYYAYFQIK